MSIDGQAKNIVSKIVYIVNIQQTVSKFLVSVQTLASFSQKSFSGQSYLKQPGSKTDMILFICEFNHLEFHRREYITIFIRVGGTWGI